MENETSRQAIIPYLLIKDGKRFIEFSKYVFDAVVTEYRERENTDIVMHAELMICGSMIMMADVTDDWRPSANSLFIWVDNADATYRKAIEQVPLR